MQITTDIFFFILKNNTTFEAQEAFYLRLYITSDTPKVCMKYDVYMKHIKT